MIRRICRLILKLWGWKIEGEFPKETPKYIAVGAPHTSNWDFILSLLVRRAQGADIKFIAKKSLFKFPYGFIFKKLGGYPVDRKKSKNIVEAVIDIYNNKERFAIAITPEGTRKKVEQLKTGFYHIAQGANIPIVLTVFDVGNKTFRIIPPFNLTGNIEEDMEIILNYFRGVKGFNPSQGIFFNLLW